MLFKTKQTDFKVLGSFLLWVVKQNMSCSCICFSSQLRNIYAHFFHWNLSVALSMRAVWLTASLLSSWILQPACSSDNEVEAGRLPLSLPWSLPLWFSALVRNISICKLPLHCVRRALSAVTSSFIISWAQFSLPILPISLTPLCFYVQ